MATAPSVPIIDWGLPSTSEAETSTDGDDTTMDDLDLEYDLQESTSVSPVHSDEVNALLVSDDVVHALKGIQIAPPLPICLFEIRILQYITIHR